MRGRIPALVLAAALTAGCADDSGGPPAPQETPSPTVTTFARPVTVTFTVPAGDTAAAATALHRRLGALGLRPDDPATSGRAVSFHVTRRLSAAERDLVAGAGHLTFRTVARTAGPAEAVPGADGTGDCGDAAYRQRVAAAYGTRDDDRARAVACDAAGDVKYVLEPAELTGVDVASARAESMQPDGTWVVVLDMRSAQRWAEATERNVGQQLAIVFDGIAYSAPTVEQRIQDGSATISGSFNEETAKALAAVLTGGALPGRATVTESG